jgi:RNA polymerase sigma factor (sigma-70 family)
MGSADESERRERFDCLYRCYAVDVLAYLRRRATFEVADDGLAETFLVVWRRLDDAPSEPRAWLLAIARRVLANQRRSSRRQGALVERLIFQRPTHVGMQPERDPVFDALGQLRRLDQEALLLVAWDGLTSVQAARVLGCSAVAVRLRLHRARRRLAGALAEGESSPIVRFDPRRRCDRRRPDRAACSAEPGVRDRARGPSGAGRGASTGAAVDRADAMARGGSQRGVAFVARCAVASARRSPAPRLLLSPSQRLGEAVRRSWAGRQQRF